MRAMAVAVALTMAAASIGAAAAETRLTVMSFNIWGGGANEGKPIDETLAAIRAANPDIVGVQETRLESDPCTADHCPAAGPSVAPALAAALGYHLYEQTAASPALWANAILSRHPIVAPLPGDLGVAIDVGGRRVVALNLHLDDAPYQPYQLLGIPYGDAPFLSTAAEAVAAATATRGPALDLVESALAQAGAAELTLVFGDFNEPSHRDWTEAVAATGRHPLAVAWPATLRLEGLGFVDAFRAAWPDALAKPGLTWTPQGDPADPEDHHDRIDHVFARGPGLRVLSAGIVGEAAPAADLVVTPWPSDHRAVVATLAF